MPWGKLRVREIRLRIGYSRVWIRISFCGIIVWLQRSCWSDGTGTYLRCLELCIWEISNMWRYRIAGRWRRRSWNGINVDWAIISISMNYQHALFINGFLFISFPVVCHCISKSCKERQIFHEK
jgi:hypothetical protein